MSQQRRAVSRHDIEMLRDNQLVQSETQNFRKGASHTRIGGNPTFECNRSVKFLSARNSALEIARDCKTKAGDDIIVGGRYLLEMYHIGLGENRASTRNARRISGAKRQLSELIFHRYVHSVCLLIEK